MLDNSHRGTSMKSSKIMSKKQKPTDYTNFAYNEAVGRLKILLADSYTPTKNGYGYSRSIHDDSESDNLSIIDRPMMSEISKYISPGYSRSSLRKYKPFISTSKENLSTIPNFGTTSAPEYQVAPTQIGYEKVQAPPEILSFLEKQEDYIEQLEKESKFCRDELSHLLGKVKDVINENETLTEHARSDLATINEKSPETSESDDYLCHKSPRRSKEKCRHLSGPNIVFESKISELEAELTQAKIDFNRLRNENDELKRKQSFGLPSAASMSSSCEIHTKQIDSLQKDKLNLENTIRKLERTIDDMKSDYNLSATKRHIEDIAKIERSQAETEIKHLRDELDRQHERVRELQHEMSRRVAEERSNAERRYNIHVDALGGDLSSQWEQVAKLQLDLERQKRLEADLKRDLSQRNSQIEELKLELKSKRSSFLSDYAQANAEKQSLEQEITSLRLQLDRSERQGKTETSRLNAEISSLRQRLDREDADLLHAKRENLRLSDEIANLEKELAYGEMKNEVRPTKKDLDQRISELQNKHVETINELEDMIQNQKQLMDKLTTECKLLTSKLEDTTLKNKEEKSQLRQTNEMLMDRLKRTWESYKFLIDKRKLNPTISESESCQEELELAYTRHLKQRLSSSNHPIERTPSPLETPLCSQSHLLMTSIDQSTARSQPLLKILSQKQILRSQTRTEQPTVTTSTTKIAKMILQKEQLPTANTPMITESPHLERTRANIRKKNQHQEISTRPHQQTQPCTPMTIQDTRDTTHSSMTLVHTTYPHTTNNTDHLSNMKEMGSTKTNNLTTMDMDKTITKSTNLNLTNTKVPFRSRALNLNQPQSQFRHQGHQQQNLEPQPKLPPDQHQLQERAEYNRERAQDLWGHQVQEEKGQTFCRNSLPRGLKDFYQTSRISLEEVNPFDLIPEFNISSPSLFERTSSSGTDTDTSQMCTPPRTAIQRY